MSIKPKKSLGQNFLINKGIVKKIIETAEIINDDTILEVGPGKGVLTEELQKIANRVISVEKDHRLINELENGFRACQNVEITESDILKFNPYSIIHTPYKIVANLPYYITGKFLRIIFEEWPTPELIVLMVQKEVAQRIVAKPPDMNLLALSVQFYAEPKIVSYVSRGSFRPMPKVDSAIIRLTPHHASWTTKHETKEQFFKLIKTAFAGKRKQLKNTIGGEILQKANIKAESRPEELSLEDWLRMVSLL